MMQEAKQNLCHWKTHLVHEHDVCNESSLRRTKAVAWSARGAKTGSRVSTERILPAVESLKRGTRQGWCRGGSRNGGGLIGDGLGI